MNIPLPKVHIILILQVLLWGVLTVCFGYFQGREAANSALIAGAIAVVPNTIFAFNVFRLRGASRARDIMRNVYWGEGIKIITTAIGFILAFAIFREEILPTVIFIVYASIYTVHWLAPIVVRL